MLRDMSNKVLTAAIETNRIEELLSSGRMPGGYIYKDHEIAWYVSGIQSPYLNGVVRAKFKKRDVHMKIKKILIYFKKRKIPMSWLIGPSTIPADLCIQLEKYGLKYTSKLYGMAIDLRKVDKKFSLPDGFAIEQVRDMDTLKKFMSTFALAFQIDQVLQNVLLENKYRYYILDHHQDRRLYIGLINGKPVATASLFLNGGVAGIYHIATIPEARRQGIGRAMTLISLHEARTLGYSIGVLTTESRLAYEMYSKIGFERYCTMSYYILDNESNQYKAIRKNIINNLKRYMPNTIKKFARKILKKKLIS